MSPVSSIDLMSVVQKRRQAEVLDWMFWDSVTIPNGNTTTEFRLFTTISGKTTQQTNMRLPGNLPNPWIFDVERILFHVALGTGLASGSTTVPTPPAAVQALTRGMLTLTVSNKPMYEQLLWLLPSGGGPFGQVALEGPAGSNILFGQNGYPMKQAQMRFKNPIRINPVENFVVTLQYPTAPNPAADTPIRVFLEGTVHRGIQ